MKRSVFTRIGCKVPDCSSQGTSTAPKSSFHIEKIRKIEKYIYKIERERERGYKFKIGLRGRRRSGVE